MITPDIFLVQEDVALLVKALKTFALEVDTPEGRKDVLTNAGIHLSFRTRLTYETSPYLFANRLVAAFREYRVSGHQPTYHPMVSLLEYLLQTHELEDQDHNLFTKLVRRGRDNFGGLEARSTVGRIESPPGEAIGTGVYAGKQLLLTCHHVIERIFAQGREQAWVRFGYKIGRYGVESGELFELNIKNFYQDAPASESTLDYALVKIIGKPDFPAAHLSHKMLSSEQEIRLIHHPRGEPVHISDIGLIMQVEEEFIKHNVEVDYGSSGAPIFDLHWNVIALHRGTMALTRPSAPGITEGVPLFSIWNNIKPYLSISQT